MPILFLFFFDYYKLWARINLIVDAPQTSKRKIPLALPLYIA
jgi:hypothetical protein